MDDYLDVLYHSAVSFFSPLSILDYSFALATFLTVYLAHSVLRFIVIAVSQKLGLYSPEHFSWWWRLPWRPFYFLIKKIMVWHAYVFHYGKKHTGGFAGPLEQLANTYRLDQIYLGRATVFDIGLYRGIGITLRRHGFFVAATGTGKTTALATMISVWRSSVFLIDPKSQITHALVGKDRRHWFRLIAYSDQTACFNFLDTIKEAIEAKGIDGGVLWSQRLAEALIITTSGSKTPYFTDTARMYLSALVMQVLSFHEQSDHNLKTVRSLIIEGYQKLDEHGNTMLTAQEAQELLMDEMANNDAFGGAIIGGVSALRSAAGETQASVLSALQEQTKWLDIPSIQHMTSKSDFSLSELKTHSDIGVSLEAPLYSLKEELAPFSRALTNFVCYTFEFVPKGKSRCLLVADELASQNYNQSFETSLAIARSYNLSVIGVVQSLTQLKAIYKLNWKSFLSEADFCCFAGGSNPDNARYVSEALGKKTITEIDDYTGQKHRRDVDVMTPEQVSKYLDPNSDRMIIFKASGQALKARIDPYFRALAVTRYNPDPDHKEPLLRRCSRRFISIFKLL